MVSLLIYFVYILMAFISPHNFYYIYADALYFLNMLCTHESLMDRAQEWLYSMIKKPRTAAGADCWLRCVAVIFNADAEYFAFFGVGFLHAAQSC